MRVKRLNYGDSELSSGATMSLEALEALEALEYCAPLAA